MKPTYSPTGKVNAIALKVIESASAEEEDHIKTLKLLDQLQKAINEAIPKKEVR